MNLCLNRFLIQSDSVLKTMDTRTHGLASRGFAVALIPIGNGKGVDGGDSRRSKKVFMVFSVTQVSML